MNYKINIIINSLHVGGAEKQSVLMARLLNSKHTVTLIVLDGKDQSPKYLTLLSESNVNVKVFTCHKLLIPFKLYTYLKENKPDILFSLLPFGNLMNGLLGSLARIKYRIGGVRNSYLETIKFIVQKFIHNRFLTASIANSISGQENHLKKGQNKKPIFYIPNCYPAPQKPEERNMSDKVTIVTVGRFVDQKNYDLAINIINNCINILNSKSSPFNIEYIIIGYGELENQLKQRITQLQLHNHITIINQPESLNKFYESADIYLCTSKFEGLSNSIMEAMGYSLPIVATNVGGNPELVHDNINGFLSKPDVDDISSKIIKLVENYDLRIAFGNMSYEIIESKFSERAFLNNFNNLIKCEFNLRAYNNSKTKVKTFNPYIPS